MTMRCAAVMVAALGLGACAPVGPDTNFDSYQSYAADRDAQLQGLPPPSTLPPATGFDPARVGAAIDAAEQGTAVPPATTTVPLYPATGTGALVGGSAALEADRPRGNAPAGIAETTSEMTGVGSPGISDEQDFDAVSQRETIESDKERIARNAAQYQVVQPTALPPREGDTQPILVQYALGTTNAIGEQMYSRSGIRLNSYEAACKRYRSPDLAQEAFLNSGGPKRDPKGLDPDGDGFACAWDPRPFRAALQ